MSNIITRVPRIWQPQSPVDVDPSHPFAKGLKALRLSSTQQSFGPLFRGARGTAEKAITSAGVGEIGTPAGAPTFTTAQITSPFFYWAVYAILDGSVGGDNTYPFAVTSASGDYIHFETTHYATHALIMRNYVGPAVTGSTVASGWVIGGVYVSVFRSLSNTSHDVNTYRIGNATSISSGTSATDISGISFQDFGSPIFGGTVSGRRRPLLMGGLSSGTISDSDVATFVKNPWQLFAPITRRIWVPVSAASGSTIAAATGAATASALAGASTAATTPASASGAASAQALTGSTIARGAITTATGAATAAAMVGGTATGSTISSAAGAATASSLAGASTSAATISAAAGAASASAAGASTATAAIGAAAGASTAADMVGVAGQGSTIGVAAGASTASAMAGASIVSASFGAAAGAASAQIVVGAAFAQAAIGSAAGVASAAAMVGGVTGGTASAAEVWSYVMSNGYTAEENVVAIRTMLEALTPAVIAEEVLHNALV